MFAADEGQQHNPTHAYSEVYSTVFNESYSEESVCRIATQTT